ncbi:MAG: class I SAM-dependent methyltransferase [Acidobacteriaceae bacterium]
MTVDHPTLQAQLGRIDIYVFDQILRGNIAPGMKVLDAGCGGGRNLVYLLREGYEVFGCDQNPGAVESVREMAEALAPRLPAQNFAVAAVERMPFADGLADVVICNAVLHFAQDDAHFQAMVAELWRVLRPGGMLFCRLGSTIGMAFEHLRGNVFRVGDGQEWFLVNEAMLMAMTRAMGGELIDPLKTTVVQASRCMTTWVVRKTASPRS